MFSDILTPLPAMGIDFTIVPGKGPKIRDTIRDERDLDRISVLTDVEREVPFLGPILQVSGSPSVRASLTPSQALRKETEGKTTLIGFIGAPWTLVAYSVEGGHSKLCAEMKRMCNEAPALAHAVLGRYTDSLCLYASHQIENGAQVLQVFESWAHHLTEQQFNEFAKPYADRIASYLKARHPEVPVVYFANGGSCFLHSQSDMAYDALAVDWRISMAHARRVVGESRILQGNVDPIVLYGSEERIFSAVEEVLREAGGRHVLNLGHGVEKDTPESAVAAFVNAAKSIRTRKHQ